MNNKSTTHKAEGLDRAGREIPNSKSQTPTNGQTGELKAGVRGELKSFGALAPHPVCDHPLPTAEREKLKAETRGEPVPQFQDEQLVLDGMMHCLRSMKCSERPGVVNAAREWERIINYRIQITMQERKRRGASARPQARMLRLRILQMRNTEREARNQTTPHRAQNLSQCAAPHPACGHLLPTAEKALSPIVPERARASASFHPQETGV